MGTKNRVNKGVILILLMVLSMQGINPINGPIVVSGDLFNNYRDYPVDGDSDIDSIANIGADGATSYLNARTLNADGQTIVEGNGAVYAPYVNNENDIDSYFSNMDGVSDVGLQGTFVNSQGTSADSTFMNLEEEEGDGYASTSNIEDFMDNVTDTESPSDLGIYSDWTEMQDSDIVENTLTEENEFVSTLDEDHYDSNGYDVDSSTDVGIETNPSQANDSINLQYMTIQEEDVLAQQDTIGVGLSTEASANANSFSFSHDGQSGTNRLLIVRILIPDGVDISGSVTYNGQALTQIINIVHSSGDYTPRAMAYYLIAPATGSNILAGSFAASTQYLVAATNLYGVDQNTPIDNETSQEGETPSNPKYVEFEVTSESGDMVMDAYTDWAWDSAIAGPGQTTQFNSVINATAQYGAGSSKTGSSTTTMVWDELGGKAEYVFIGWNVNVATISNYELDFEYAWTASDNNDENEQLIINIQTATQGGETLNAWEWTGSAWSSLGTVSSDGNNTFTLSHLTFTSYYIKLNDSNQGSDPIQHSWNIDLITVKTWSVNYRFDRQFGFTDVDFGGLGGEELAIKTGIMGSESINIDVWGGSSWINIATIVNSNDNTWINISISAYLTSSAIGFRFIDSSVSSDTSSNTWEIDAVLIHSWSSEVHDYELNFEYQWTSADATQANSVVSIWVGTRSDAENIEVDYWNGASWINLEAIDAASTHFNFTATGIATTYTLRFTGSSETGDATQTNWDIDLITLRTWTDEILDYELKWEHQAQGIDLTKDTYNITVYGSATENIRIQTWDIGIGTWNAPIAFEIGTTERWYNHTIESNAVGENITWRYVGSIESGDNIQSSLNIDYVGIAGWNYSPVILTKDPDITYETTVYFGDTDTLSGTWNDTDDQGIESGSIDLVLTNDNLEIVYSNNYPSITDVDGYYDILLNYTQILPGEYSWNLTISKLGYSSASVTFGVTVLPMTTIDPTHAYDPIVYFGDTDLLSGTWNDTNDQAIENGSIELVLINDNLQIVYSANYPKHTDAGGYYEILLDYTQMLPGDYSWNMTISKSGYIPASVSFDVTILPMTTVDPDFTYAVAVYFGANDAISGIWNDTDDGLIENANIQLTLTDEDSLELFSEIHLSATDTEGYFNISVDYSQILPGEYFWNLTMSKPGYTSKTIIFNLTIIPMPTTDPSINHAPEVIVDETDLLSGIWTDINTGPIGNADVQLTLLDSNSQPVANMNYLSSTDSNGYFAISLDYTDIFPGNYSWYLTFNKTGYMSSTLYIEVNIQPKNVVLTILPDSILIPNAEYRIFTNVTQSDGIQAAMMLNEFGEPLSGVQVNIEIIILLTNSSQSLISLSQNTNSFGIAIFILSAEQTANIQEILGISASIDDPYISETTVEIPENELPEVQENVIIPTTSITPTTPTTPTTSITPTDNQVPENAIDLLTLVLAIVSVLSLTLIVLKVLSGRKGSGELEKGLLEFYFIRNIQLLLIKNLNGLPVFERKFAQLETDPTLLAGLSHALSLFIDEVSKGGGQVEYLERGDFSLISVRGTNTILTLISGSGFPKRYNQQIIDACNQIEAEVFPNVSGSITMIGDQDDRSVFDIFDKNGILLGLLDKLMINHEELAKATNGIRSSPGFEILSSFSEYVFFQLPRLIESIEGIGVSQEDMAKIILEAYSSKIIIPYEPQPEVHEAEIIDDRYLLE